jgi:TP901 family phage tail tape measure protein
MSLLPPVIAELTASNSEFLAKMAESKAAMDDVADSGGSSFDKLSAQGGVMAAALGGALVAVGGTALDLGMKFQESTAQLAASAGISVAAATSIGNAFLSTAGKTEFSAQQMMQAYAPVAGQLGVLAGHALTASQALSFMDSASDLAEASGTDLSDATKDLASVMEAYGIKLSDANGASNILYNTSRLTGTGLDNLTTVVLRLHSTLGDLAPPLSQVGGLMVDLTKQGETGRQAISGVSTAMTTLMGSFKAGQTSVSSTTLEIQQLGLTVFNSQGQFVGLSSIIGQLHDKIATLNPEQQQLAMTNLFGAGAAAKMLDVVDAGPAAYDKYTDAVDKTGSAHQAAEQIMETFEGRLKTIEAAVEDEGAKLGLWLIPKVELLTHDLMEGVEWLDHHRDALYALAAVVAGYATVAIGTFAVETIGGMITKVEEAGQGVVNFGAKILGLDAPFAAAETETEALTAATTGVGASMQAAATQIETSMSALQSAIEENTAAIQASLGGIDTSAASVAAGFTTETDAMAAEYQALRAELSTPIEVPPVAGGVDSERVLPRLSRSTAPRLKPISLPVDSLPVQRWRRAKRRAASKLRLNSARAKRPAVSPLPGNSARPR